ncbi:PspC domain-containing protein [Stakelama saccharophila]|uniref:PspC domain-containing protein n=1 Tax=Stakelama saccharophila TaxID=3075605 RepID=A0ABZ0BAX2_9SPHN|nr:PspC domain-containing protein [Stakelama sp. W311]WNO54423.1 PspC domain-containing protein [Stakelama sp. W311]
MRRTTPPLFNRPDTLLGVCEGLGRDIGVNSNLFRLAFAGLLFWNPAICLATYFGLGVVVYSLHWLVPDRDTSAPASDGAAHRDADNEGGEVVRTAAA